MSTSYKKILVSYFDIKNVPADYRLSAFRAWELSAKEQLEQKTSLINLSNK